MAENIHMMEDSSPDSRDMSEKCPYTGIRVSDDNDVDKFDIKTHILQMTMAMNVKSPEIRGFYQAILEKKVNIIETLLVEKKVDVNHLFIGSGLSIQPWHLGCRAIHIISEQHKEEKSKSNEILKLLLKHGADVMQRNKIGDLAIHIACKFGNYYAVQLFLDQNQACKDVKNNHGITPLIKALFHFRNQYKKSYIKVVTTLVNAGCDVNLSPDSGISPLHVPVVMDKDLTKILVNAGANVNAICKDGNSPLLKAMCQPHIQHDIVKILLEAGADTTVSTSPGRTPLHIAVSKSDDISVQHLLKHGADANAQDMYHITPMWLAVTEHNMKILPMLVANGGDVNLRTESKKSLLTAALENNDSDMTMLLIKLGVRLSQELIRKENPLFHAIKNRSLRLVKLLLQENCPMDFPPYCSPETTALMVGDLEILQVMGRAGAKFDSQKLMEIGKKMDQGKCELFYSTHFQDVRPLQHLACIRVRKMLGLNIRNKLQQLVAEHYISQNLVSDILLSEALRL